MYSQIDSNKRQSVLLMMIFIAVIIGLGYVFDMVWGAGNYSFVIFAILFSFGMTAISYFQGDKIALWTSGAKAITKEENAYVYRMVENLAITNGTPTPKIYIIEDSAINAFATGRKPELSSIAVTRGAIEKLTNEELEGVLAHELSHVKNYDIRFMTLVAVLVGAISILSNIFLRSRWLPRRSNDRDNNIGAIFMIIGVVLAILSPIIAELIKLAISRRREYLADASGALLTRYPEGLAKALEKIAAENMPMRSANQATAHMFLANPFSPDFSSQKIEDPRFRRQRRNRDGLYNLFSTHPPVEDRIKKLREMT